VYIKIEQQHQEQYSFLLNLFYSQLFNEMMAKIPSKNDLALYCLLDEF
jgi:type IV secretion system protein VirD4